LAIAEKLRDTCHWCTVSLITLQFAVLYDEVYVCVL